MSNHTQSPSVIDVLRTAVESSRFSQGCAVNRWACEQGEDVQALLQQIIDNRRAISAQKIFNNLNAHVDLPFGITVFRYHLSGECACRKK